jgi:hypothetical protein
MIKGREVAEVAVGEPKQNVDQQVSEHGREADQAHAGNKWTRQR